MVTLLISLAIKLARKINTLSLAGVKNLLERSSSHMIPYEA